MSIKYYVLFLIFIGVSNFANAFNCYSSSNRGQVGAAGSACDGMLIVSRSNLLGATFSGSDAYVSSGGTNYYFGGTNGGVFTGQITNFSNIFRNKTTFNADIGYWDTSRATNFRSLFENARSFNQDIGNWDVSGVQSFVKTFFNARAFNQDLNNWDTQSVNNIVRVFAEARAFNGDISSWDVDRVRNMTRAFDGARSFNQDISGWDVSNATRMVRMFKNALVFDQDLTQWDVTKIRKEPKVFANRLPSSKRPCWGLSSCPTTPLSLSSSSPADGAFDVSTSTTLTLNFSDTVYTTADVGNILLYKTDGALVETFNVKDSGSVTISGAQVSVDLNLEDNTDYYIQISSRALAGSAPPYSYLSYYPGILNATTLNFSTRSSDTIAPTLASSSPQDDATNAQYKNTVLRLGFSEDIVIGAGNIKLYNSGGLVQAYDVSDTDYVSISDGSSLEVPLVDNNGDSVLSAGKDYYVLMDSGIVKDASENLFTGITSSSTLNFTTNTAYCGCISGTTWRRNGNVLAGVTVKLLNSSGSVIQSTVSDANGFYHFLPEAAGIYSIEFSRSNGRPVVGQASYDGMSLSGSSVKNIEITTSCDDITEIDGILVDPKGVIYDSESRSPVANATVELLLNGSVIDDSFLDSSGGAASQVTGADGEYSFVLKADTATSGTYEIRVTPPTGYIFESNEIPADALYTPSIGNGLEAIQDQSTAPASGDDTTYHLKFAFTFSTTAGESSQGIINNHIPIDPALIPEIEDDLINILRDDIAITIAQLSKQIAGYSTDALERLKLEKQNSCEDLVGKQFAPEPVLFSTASVTITPSGSTFLNALAELLVQCPDEIFIVEGHADSIGSHDYNLRLSYARSAAVISALVSRGLKSERFIAFGYGESRPIAENVTEEGRRLNRRVVFLPAKPLRRNIECEANINYPRHFYASVDDEGANVDGLFSSNPFGCGNGARKFYEVRGSYMVQGTDTRQGMVTFNYLTEQNGNPDRHSGHFSGVYATTNSIASEGTGNINGFGLNLGLYGAQKVDTKLYLDYYLGAAAGQHRFDLSFARASGDINSNGYYSYLATFAGVALSGETQIGDQRLAPRAGVEVAYSPGGKAHVNASREAINDLGALETGTVNGGRVFGELRFVDLLPSNKVHITIAPSGFCETHIGTGVRQCGTGISLGFSRQIEEGTYFDFGIGGEVTRTSSLYDLNLEYGLKLKHGQLIGSTSVDANGANEFGMTYELSF